MLLPALALALACKTKGEGTTPPNDDESTGEHGPAPRTPVSPAPSVRTLKTLAAAICAVSRYGRTLGGRCSASSTTEAAAACVGAVLGVMACR